MTLHQLNSAICRGRVGVREDTEIEHDRELAGDARVLEGSAGGSANKSERALLRDYLGEKLTDWKYVWSEVKPDSEKFE